MHLKERAVIVCNGPSLNEMDLSFLENETVIGLNKIYLGFEKFNFYPQYYVAVNEKVLRQSQEHIKKLDCEKFLSNRATDLYVENENTHILVTDKPYARFCEDIERGLNEGWTVTYAALQVAYYMGFSEVVIIGMDHRYDFVGTANETQVLNGPDTNHFSEDYFGGGQEWDNPDMVKSEESYRVARELYEKAGRRVIDATLDGACDIFVKESYQTLFDI